MAGEMRAPVLILGGSGVVGSRAVKTVRQLHPELPLAIAGRDQDKSRALAAEVGDVEVVEVDLGRADLALARGGAYSAVVALLKENTLNPLRYAQTHGVPYLSMADGAFEIGPATALHMYRPRSAPVLLASHWMAGMATLPALHFAREFSAVRSIAIAVVLDPDDPIGPMANEDVEQLAQNSPRPLLLDNGTWRWAGEELAVRRVEDLTGAEIEVHAMSVLDVLSLAAATDARSVRFDFGMARTAGYRRVGAPYHDMIIEIEGDRRDGTNGRARFEIEAPQGTAGLTALGVALCVERLLGLVGGDPVGPGLYFPELIIEPAHGIRRLGEFGGKIRRIESAAVAA